MTPLASDLEATRRRLNQLDDQLHFSSKLPRGLSLTAGYDALAIARRDLDALDLNEPQVARPRLEQIVARLEESIGLELWGDDEWMTAE